jgi:RNA polymerase sigma-70 factor (ECF subfamily)
LDVLAPDVVLLTDGGGIKQAARVPVLGPEKIIRFIFATSAKHGVLTSHPTVVNGAPALALHLNGELDGVIAFRIADSLIDGMYYVRNPEKLTGFATGDPIGLP